MNKELLAVCVAWLTTLSCALAQQKTVTIAVVNNPDMIRLKKLSSKFEEKNSDNMRRRFLRSAVG